MEITDVLSNYMLPGIDLLGYPGKDYLSTVKESDYVTPVIWSADEEAQLIDLEDYKHVLIIGATGTGKTAFIHQLLLSLFYKKHPTEIKLILIDLKKIEFKPFILLEKHFLAKVNGAPSWIVETPSDALRALQSLCIEMDARYELLTLGSCRDYHEYNHKILESRLDPEKGQQYLPVLIACIDELADCILVGKKEIDEPLQKLVYNAGKVGIFLIVSTNQYSGSHVVSSALLKGFQYRIAFRFNDKEDYRTYFDTVRVPELNKPGEFIFCEFGKPVKGKSYLFSDTEINSVCKFISDQPGFLTGYALPGYFYEKQPEDFETDPLFEDAARLIVQSQMGSTSLIQRRMKLGYNRAGRLMDQLEAAGIVGPNKGSDAREVLFDSDTDLQKYLDSLNDKIPYVKKQASQTDWRPQNSNRVTVASPQIRYNNSTTKSSRQNTTPLWVIVLAILALIGLIVRKC